MATGLRPPARGAGFTLVELMIATLIFSMIIAGLAAIYTTAFSQSGGVLRESRLRTDALLSFRSFTQRMVTASRVDLLAPSSSGNAVRGCAGWAPDGTPYGTPATRKSFAFCVQPSAVAPCGGTDAPPPCLFVYDWDNICPVPASPINAGNCGGTVDGKTPELVAAGVLPPGALPPDDDCTVPGNTDYFTRGGNDIRLRVRLCRKKKGKFQRVYLDGSTMANGQFDSRL